MKSKLRRKIAGWFLFDFANSILIINGGLYFPQWVVIDNGISDFWFNLTISLSSLLLILTAPALGLLSDKRLGPIIFLRVTSLIMFLAALVLGLVAIYIPNVVIRVSIALVTFFIIMYCYQLSLVFYNSILGSLSRIEGYARVSGAGLAAGWIGGVLGIFFILPFVEGYIPLSHLSGRVNAFLPSAILFGILIFVSLYLLGRDSRPDKVVSSSQTFTRLYKELWNNLRNLKNQRNILFFLMAYFFFADAILTIQNNSTIYLEKVMLFSDTIKAYVFLLLLIMAAIGGIVSGYVSGKLSPKKTLLGILIGWLIVLTAISLTSNPITFIVLFGFVGLLFGGTWNMARVLLLILVPSERRGQYFGIYSSYERVASIIGPLIWSAPVVFLYGMGSGSYRLALILMALLIAIGVLLLRKVHIPQSDNSRTS